MSIKPTVCKHSMRIRVCRIEQPCRVIFYLVAYVILKKFDFQSYTRFTSWWKGGSLQNGLDTHLYECVPIRETQKYGGLERIMQ